MKRGKLIAIILGALLVMAMCGMIVGICVAMAIALPG